MLVLSVVLSTLFFFIYVALSQATESDPFKNLDIDFSDLVNNEKKTDNKFDFYLGGYLESRDQVRIKEMDEPISLRQRLWLDCYLGQDWIRGLPLFRFRQRAASCLLVFILSSRYQDIVLIYLQRVSITLSLR